MWMDGGHGAKSAFAHPTPAAITALVITFAVVLAVNQIPVFGASAGARLRNG